MKLTLGMSNLKFSLDETHPNKMIIEGCITKIGQPSDGAAIGSGGKNIVFTKESVDKCANTYEMMPVNVTFPDDWDCCYPGTQVFTGHGDIIPGVIEKVWADNEDLMATIVVWKMLFPDISFMTINAKDSLGFSIECSADKTHYGIDDGYMYIDEFTGLGCAMLFKNTAAFSGTYIKELVASLQNKPNKKDDVDMNKEEMQIMLDAMFANFEAKLAEVKASMEEKVGNVIAEVKAEVEKANNEITTLATSFAETKEEIKATKEEPVVEPAVVQASVSPEVKPPVPTVLAAGQTVVPNSDFTDDKKDKKQRLAEVWAGDGSIQEKMKKVVQINAE